MRGVKLWAHDKILHEQITIDLLVENKRLDHFKTTG